MHYSDACGVGFIADRSTRRSHGLLCQAIECLHNLDHRGAKTADGTGDGAGIMTRIPYRLFERELERSSVPVPEQDRLGVLVTFFPDEGAAECREVVERSVAAGDVEPLLWRQVPMAPQALSPGARETLPVIQHLIVAAGNSIHDQDEFERRLLLARRATWRALTARNIEGLSTPSSSCRTIVYKGFFTASNIEKFYLDLVDPVYETDFAIFHQRYSTNTFPSWDLAQPRRMVAHNGEINTIRSNRAWTVAREVDFESDVWGDQAPGLRPFVWPGKSDSANLDNVIELLVRSGRSLAHTKEMLIPAAWENVSDLDPELRAFYEYHAFLTEPWDGPAAIVASDGVTLLAGMDRNGLRPARWTLTPDIVLVASEVGIAPRVEVDTTSTGQLGPGEVIAVDLNSGEVSFSDDVKRHLAARRPYADWIDTQTVYVQDPFDPLQDRRFDVDRYARVFGYTAEERRLLFTPMAEGREPVGSMGNDTPLAALAATPQRLTRFFHQLFAQVTNPPIDPIRERMVMSLRTYVGRRGSILEETPQQAHLMELSSPVLSDAEVEHIVGSTDASFRSAWLDALFPVARGTIGLMEALDDICRRAETAVRGGATIIVLSDREMDGAMAPIPAVLAVGAVHHHLIRTGVRLHASLVVVSGEPRDAHDLACLIGFGASAVNPYLGIEQARALAADGKVAVDPVTAQENYRAALETGLLKVLSKMGICTVSAYRGSELFEAVGLDEQVTKRAFRFVSQRVGGVGFDRIAADAIARHARWHEGAEPEGFYRHRRGGTPHINSPRAVLALQRAVQSADPDSWDQYLHAVERREPALLRDLLAITTDAEAIDPDKVEDANRVMRRFTLAGMSLGALSREAHEALAAAASLVGTLSNSGEGGEDPKRYGTPRNSAIKQVASGRFGVTPAYLASAEEIQIKMAQGSKPGEGGQLPGHKVSAEIARLRSTKPGVTLISPPPHHDIYSIEDLAQLIYDLRAFRPQARVGVKLVSAPGVGTIAVGVAKAGADVITISGNEGGTAASPLVSIKHAGSPLELGVAEAHQALLASGLRERIILETDGGLRTGRDVVVASLLGAERFGFGTLALLALGCKMVRQCHENTCPVGITTQREDLRARFTGAPDQVVQLLRLLADDVRRHLAVLGARSLDEIAGRTDLLHPVEPDHPVARRLASLLAGTKGSTRRKRFQPARQSPLGEMLAVEGIRAIEDGRQVQLAYPVRNTDRAVGTRLAGEIAGLADRPTETDPSTVTIRLSGTAGQSLGAFLTDRVSIHLDGTANDCVGKGMGGGLITVSPPRPADGPAHGAGNAVLYGATGGRLHIAGAVGQRFAVRNSGAIGVVEGASDHACEYMTGGVVAILGPVGRNTAAGMTGGTLYLWDPQQVAPRHLADTAPPAVRPEDGDLDVFWSLVEDHSKLTGSKVAFHLLEQRHRRTHLVWLLRAQPSSIIDLRHIDEPGAALPLPTSERSSGILPGC